MNLRARSNKGWNYRYESYLEPTDRNLVSKWTQVQERGIGEGKGPIFGGHEPHTLRVLFAGVSAETFLC